MRQGLLVGLMVVSVLGGCAFVKQAKLDYDVGKSTPTAEGELTPRDAANALVDPIRPFVPAAGILVGVLTVLGTWNRGRRLRKNLPVSSNPITGHLGEKVGLEAIVQHFSNFMTGAFEWGATDSATRRIIKVALAMLAAFVVSATTIPSVSVFLQDRPWAAVLLTTITALITGLEKAQSKVLPLEPTS